MEWIMVYLHLVDNKYELKQEDMPSYEICMQTKEQMNMVVIEGIHVYTGIICKEVDLGVAVE